MEATMANLVGGIIEQQKRVREEIIPRYEEIGPNGQIGLMFLRMAVDNGDKALASGDIELMIRAYKELESCE